MHHIAGNLWSYLLAGMVNGIMSVIIIPLFGGPANYHQAIGLGSKLSDTSFVVLQMGAVAFENFDLAIPAVCLGITMTLWGIRLLMNTYLAIKRLIPFIG